MSAPLVVIKRPFTNSTTRNVKRLQLFKKIFISNLSEMYTSVKDITNFLKNISFFTDKISNKNNTLIDSITSLSSSSSYNLNSIKQIENLITKINDNALTFKNSFESLNNTISQIKSDLNEFKL